MRQSFTLFLLAVFVTLPSFVFATDTANLSADQNLAVQETAKTETGRSGWFRGLFGGSDNGTSDKKTGVKKLSTKPDLKCVQSAIDVREGAAITAFSAQSDAVKSALEARRVALVNVYSIENKKDREAARKTAWDTFRTSLRVANKTKAGSQKATWEKFRTDVRACGGSVSAEASLNEKLIPVSDTVETL